jgi:hypothetical protein
MSGLRREIRHCRERELLNALGVPRIDGTNSDRLF